MSCAEFRTRWIERVAASGRAPQNGAADTHFVECPDCRRWRDEHRRADELLDLLSEVDVPPPRLARIAERALAAARAEERRAGPARWLRRAAAAALLATALAAGWRLRARGGAVPLPEDPQFRSDFSVIRALPELLAPGAEILDLDDEELLALLIVEEV